MFGCKANLDVAAVLGDSGVLTFGDVRVDGVRGSHASFRKGEVLLVF